jgi:hypothetical protein
MVYEGSQAAILSYLKEKVSEFSVQSVLACSILNWEMITEGSRLPSFDSSRKSSAVQCTIRRLNTKHSLRNIVSDRVHSLIRQEKSENSVVIYEGSQAVTPYS